jgi:hypothetical protein
VRLRRGAFSRWPPRAVRLHGLALAWPRRHRGPDGGEGLEPERAELKARSDRDSQAGALIHLDDLLLVARPPPHLSPSPQEVPDLLDCAMHDRDGRFTGTELEMCHPATRNAEQYAHVRAVWSDVRALCRESLGLPCARAHIAHNYRTGGLQSTLDAGTRPRATRWRHLLIRPEITEQDPSSALAGILYEFEANEGMALL